MKLKKKQKRKIFFCIIGLILLISMYLDTYLIIKYNVFPFKYLAVYSVIFVIVPILLIFYTIFKKRKSKLKGIIGFFEIIYIMVLFGGFFYLNKTFNFLDAFTNNYNYETKIYYVITLNNSNYKDVKDLENKNISYANNIDSSASTALKEIEKKVKMNSKEVAGYGEMLEKLDSNEYEGALIVQSYYDVLLENDESIAGKYKIIYKFSIKEKVIEYVKDVDVTKETFNIYIAGIDSYDSVTTQNKSDVNIIMSVNPKTNKIILINIPRDYYIPLYGHDGEKKLTGEEKDKLTHAGSYGVETSIKSLEKLLDCEINYYVKLNYNALINLVDALDGVEVYSEYDFVSYELYHKFKKGMNNVDGPLALDFVRTRKAFRQGDRVRGENQQRMIQAIFKKVMSPSILIKYGDLLNAVDGSFATNISTNKITSLINMQLDKMPSWEIENLSLNGSDSYELTYSYKKQELYVMIPNEETINEVKDALILNK